MARSEARLQFGCWRTGLTGLSPHAKLLYCVLLTEPTLNHCGVGRACLPLWAENASLTMEEAEKALRELTDGSWVLLDESTYEVFVRTLIRNDGVAAQPYVLKGALREALLAESPRIRVALAAELRRLPARAPDGVSKTGRKVTYPDPHETADLLDPPSTPKPTRKAPETLFEGVEKGSETLHGGGGGGGGGTSSSADGSVRRSAQSRGTRLPEDFTVTADMVAWVRENHPTVDGRAQTAAFKDHFRAAPGQKGVKVDWTATWRNWMRKAEEMAPRTGSPRHLAPVPATLPSDPREAFADLRSRGAASDAARILCTAWIEPSQPPSDPTPPREWLHARRVEWIDAHAEALRAALTGRKTG